MVLRMVLIGTLMMPIVACEELFEKETEKNTENDPIEVIEMELCVDTCHAHAVDLGLSIKWSCCNVGAYLPEECGNYYCWGGLEEMEEDYNFSGRNYRYPDSNISGTIHDVAHMKWGDNWRMPTHAEWQELIDSCVWQRVILNGIKGMLVTGPNDNSIFLPSAGYRGMGETFSCGDGGCYWSGTVGESESTADPAWSFQFAFNEKLSWIMNPVACYESNGFYANSIRPVKE